MLEEIIRRRLEQRKQPGEEELRRLPDRKAFIYGRVSSPKQVVESEQSVMQIARLVTLAKADGHATGLDPGQVGQWLQAIRAGTSAPGVLEDGDVIVDVRDLGRSGTLPEKKKAGLSHVKERLKRHELGVIYVTEGAGRLIRDKSRVLSSELLELMKESNCKLRTPERVLSPQVERDWERMRQDFDEAAEELTVMGKRLHLRRRDAAEAGKHIGSTIPAGLYVPIVGQDSSGRYRFGPWAPYGPHVAVVKRALRELVGQGGRRWAAARALGKDSVVFPFFPPELSYMNTRSALKSSPRAATGWAITPRLLQRLAQQPALVGTWLWGDICIQNHHEAVVERELLEEACRLTFSPQPRGRAAQGPISPWIGVLWCYHHQAPHRISIHAVQDRLLCDKEYHNATGPLCLNVAAHTVLQRLTEVFLRSLELTPCAEEVLAGIQADIEAGRLEQKQRRKEEQELLRHIEQLRGYLGNPDPKKEATYWELIQRDEDRLAALRGWPGRSVKGMDVARVRQFLWGLWQNWDKYDGGLRNQFVRSLVDRVEIRHSRHYVEAVLVWKSGETETIHIERPPAPYTPEKRWRPEEDKLLKSLWPTASPEALLGALPGRTWESLSQRARVLQVRRERQRRPSPPMPRWTQERHVRLAELYRAGVPLADIARELGRSEGAVEARASLFKIRRPSLKGKPRQEARWAMAGLSVKDFNGRPYRWQSGY